MSAKADTRSAHDLYMALMNVLDGIGGLLTMAAKEKAVELIKLHTAAAVAEAREPLVAALELVEWIDCVVNDGEDEDSWRECACCRNRREQGHTPDCQVGAALAKGKTV